MFQKTVIDHVDAALANRVYKIRYFLDPPPKSLCRGAAAPTACLRRAGDLSRPTQTSSGVKIRVYKGLSKHGIINVIVFHLKITHTSRFLRVH